METGGIGKDYRDGEIIVRQGEVGNCMYVIQSGKVEVVEEVNGKIVPLAVLGENDFFGEMAIFEDQVRSATVRALGAVRVLTVDKKTLLRRIQQDPALAFRLLEHLCHRLRKLDFQVARVKTSRDS
ncbi:MAG TPA: cyclic nucleotide-binding domain-containing protein [Candidatus Binatia bacterium]|nr:cyclic nucleotide-binding domain-containing protein [Candidatus Binatia bacterium]